MKELVEDVASSDAKRASAAVRLLIKRRDPVCVPILLPLAISEDIEVQSRAVMVLSHFLTTQHREIWEFMAPLLLRGDRSRKAAALLALEDLPVAEAIPVLKRIAMRSTIAQVRAGALACLAAVARIKSNLRPELRGTFEKAAASRISTVRLAGLEGLCGFHDSRYDRILLGARHDKDPGIRARYASYALEVEARSSSGAPKKRRS